jgi:hypothetical protein
MSEISKKYKIRGLVAICRQAIKNKDYNKLEKYFNKLKGFLDV